MSESPSASSNAPPPAAKVKLYSLILVRDRSQKRVLLGYKKRGFGQGKWNGFGGKVEHGESIVDSAKRELHEETSLTSDALSQVGLIHFEFKDNPVLLECHVFACERFTGTPTECDEMRPAWYAESDIPYSQMWADDYLWWPLYLADKLFYGYFNFDGTEVMTGHKLRQVTSKDEFEALMVK